MNDDNVSSPQGGGEKISPDTNTETYSQNSDDDSIVSNNSGAIAVSKQKAEDTRQRLKRKFKSVGLKLWPSTKRQKIIGGIIAVLVIIGGVAAVQAIRSALDKREVETPAVVVPKTTEPSKLTGVEINPELNKRTVTSVMIENSPDARPQAGLVDAGVVFEAIAEGGITRFNALFLEGKPSFIGPVRSVRPYYVDWLAGFDASIAHAGGSAQGLAKVSSLRIKDLDHGNTPGGTFDRISQRTAPHNLFTTMDKLDKASKSKGFKTSNFEGFKRKPELQNTGEAKVKNISFNISSSNYNVSFKYDPASNSYNRFLAGQPHRDYKTRKQIKPKVVIALITSWRQNGIYSVYGTTGKGSVIVFQDGKATKGIWKKAAPKKPLKFFDAKGNVLQLNPGQTWITALRSGSEAKY